MNELLNEYADMTYSEYELHIQGIVDSIITNSNISYICY